jgi:aminoglycoside phosphotransferase (APT) family kinase protein
VSPTWTAQRAISIELAAALIDTQFPQLAPARLVALASGWDNSGFIVNGTWMFRFPRREIAVPLLARECALLPWLGPRLPLAIPDPTHAGHGDNAYPWPFAGYRLLPGRPAWEPGLDDDARSRAAVPLGSFLKALHAVDPDEARRHGAGDDELGRLDLERRSAQITEGLEHLAGLGLVADPAPLFEIVADVPRDWKPGDRALVHGDLHGGNLLVDESAIPCGVVDWGDVHLGDPAIDLAVCWSYLPVSAHAAFRAAYGPIDEAAWRVARFKALHHAVILLAWGHDTAREDVKREATLTLQRLA